jgi:hypothetical protein
MKVPKSFPKFISSPLFSRPWHRVRRHSYTWGPPHWSDDVVMLGDPPTCAAPCHTICHPKHHVMFSQPMSREQQMVSITEPMLYVFICLSSGIYLTGSICSVRLHCQRVRVLSLLELYAWTCDYISKSCATHNSTTSSSLLLDGHTTSLIKTPAYPRTVWWLTTSSC